MRFTLNLFIFFWLSTAFSFADDMDDLFSMTLQELVDLDVTTVSKREESLINAPGVITVITGQDIKNYGATSLKDVLLRLPNYYLFDSYALKASGTMLRAGATQHLNNHVLYLINGRPLRESQNGGLHTDINNLFPINFIERIEVIRGPGSVLYGSNAYSGTINIITKSESKSLKGELSTQHGSNGFSSQYIGIESQLNSEIEIGLHGQYLDYDGETISFYDETGTIGDETTGKDGHSLILNLGLYDFNVTVLDTKIRSPAVSGPFNWGNKATWNLTRTFVDIGLVKELNEFWGVTLNITANNQSRDIDLISGNDSEFESDGQLWEASIKGEMNDNTYWVSGILFDLLKGDLGDNGGEYEAERYGAYTQVDYEFSKETKIIGGVQWNKPDGVNADISPRLGMVHKYDDHWSSKLLYAKAFRSPYGGELFFDAPFLQGDEKLTSEIIQTYELQLNYVDDTKLVAATYYHSVADDLIGRASIDGVTTFINVSEEIEYSGFELEWNWQLNDRFRLQGSGTYQENKDEAEQEDIMLGANEMMKVGVAYQSSSDISVGLWNSYIGAAHKLEDLEGSNPNVVNPESKSVNLLSLNIESSLFNAFDSPLAKKIILSAYFNNILDEEVWYPELGRRTVNTVPQSHDRGLFITLKYHH